jgi:hypothetical protein
MLEIFTDCDFRNAEPVTEISDADPAFDFDGTSNRIVPQGGFESDGVIRGQHLIP